MARFTGGGTHQLSRKRAHESLCLLVLQLETKRLIFFPRKGVEAPGPKKEKIPIAIDPVVGNALRASHTHRRTEPAAKISRKVSPVTVALLAKLPSSSRALPAPRGLAINFPDKPTPGPDHPLNTAQGHREPNLRICQLRDGRGGFHYSRRSHTLVT